MVMVTKWSLFVLAGLVALVGCRAEPSSAVAERRDIVGMESLEAELITPPTDRVLILPTYRAPVERVMVTVGASVKRGDVLVELSFPNAQAAYDQAQLNVKTAESNLAKAGSTYDETVAEWKSRVLALRKANAEGTLADPAELASAERELADAQRVRSRALAPYQIALEQARDSFNQAKSGAKLASIRTPITGTVLMLDVQPGQEVGADREEPLAEVVDLEALEVHVAVPAGLAIEEGDKFVLAFKDVPGESFDGEVSKVITVAGSDGQRKAVVQFSNKMGLVKPGMEPTASMVTGEVKDVVSVPSDAVDKDESGKPIVNILKNGEWMPTVVEVGLSGGGYTEIKSGIAEGDTVQVTP